ncbi:uncharacterized protein BYT42DRAFT_98558 [Radiomyces spectabilis]|uniref:uncharacterized protein n=1 Tax=Radiomyces spectabilis TaxID=64574 RepID=UPI00221E4304|nr:uncharacterized protein BYT42DRAFT_98558 [Radiomyces spectabilis]KAI8370675.1 hypothetical protein BYT42DRAFT_98558 [Radiomyces spectabilis]
MPEKESKVRCTFFFVLCLTRKGIKKGGLGEKELPILTQGGPCQRDPFRCSKTRPTCLRCARSNQTCEYPDAPPNLTNLSQKVLDLYDTLRELEGHFLDKYMHTMNDDQDLADDHDNKPDTSPTPLTESPMVSVSFDCSSRLPSADPPSLTADHETPPSNWSIVLSIDGLSLQTCARTLTEFRSVAYDLAHQLCRDFGEEYLPSGWDIDHDAEYESDYELEEDEYLVTVPIFSIESLLPSSPVTPPASSRISTAVIDPSQTTFDPHLAHFVHEIESKSHLISDQPTPFPHLLPLLKELYPLSLAPAPLIDSHDYIPWRLSVVTAYIASVSLLDPPSGPSPSISWQPMAAYATSLLIDGLLQLDGSPGYVYPLCATVLAWVHTVMNDTACIQSLMHIAVRSLLCTNDWRSLADPCWSILISCLVHLNVYVSIFWCQCPPLGGGTLTEMWHVAAQLKQSSVQRIASLGIQTELIHLLDNVLGLFYKVNIDECRNPPMLVRKLDVDDVLSLVRDLENWEQQLPSWAQWKATISSDTTELPTQYWHIHMIYNITQILLYRPFCTEFTNDGVVLSEEQTHTKSTFLDMSMTAAHRLAECLGHRIKDKHWNQAAQVLIEDVFHRVRQTFDSDPEILQEIEQSQTILKAALDRIKLP